MRKLTMLLAVLWLTAGAAFAQDDAAETDLAAGFRLGKLYMSAHLLAAELEIIQALDESLVVERITDENYESGAITDDDVTGARLFLGYTIWRLQFMVIPVCEAGLADNAFSEPSTAPFKDEAQALLADLLVDIDAFLAGEDYGPLADFVDATIEAGYAAQLTDLAARAQAAAGVEDDAEPGIEAEGTL